MKVKNRNISEVCLQAMCLILLFLNPFFNGWTYRGVAFIREKGNGMADCGQIKAGPIKGLSVYDILRGVESGTSAIDGIWRVFLCCGLILACLIGLALFIRQLLSTDDKRNNVITLFAPIIELAIILIMTFAGGFYYGESKFHGYRYNYSSGNYEKGIIRPSTFYYIFIVLLIVLIILSIAGYFLAKKKGIEDEVVQKDVVVVKNTSSVADELRAYKELLDSGVITQEEFDEKKKQLLGL